MKTIIAKGRGKTFERSLDAARKRVKDGEIYLIRRRGLWFRPKAQGYTDELAGVGLFDAEDARGYLAADGVSVVPYRHIQGQLAQEIVDLEQKASGLRRLMAEAADVQEAKL